jgi:hypothetical protein
MTDTQKNLNQIKNNLRFYKDLDTNKLYNNDLKIFNGSAIVHDYILSFSSTLCADDIYYNNLPAANVYNNFRFSSGPAAANAYNDNNNTQLTIDWSYDGIYFKYDNTWITLSIGPKTINHEMSKIDTAIMKYTFKKLCLYAIEELNKLTNKDTIVKKIEELIAHL